MKCFALNTVIGVIFMLGTLQGNSLLEMFTVGVSLTVAAIHEGEYKGDSN